MQKNKYVKYIYLFLALLTMLMTSFIVYAEESSDDENISSKSEISTLSEISTSSEIATVSEIEDEEELLYEEEMMNDDSYNIDIDYLFFDYLYKSGITKYIN